MSNGIPLISFQSTGGPEGLIASWTWSWDVTSGVPSRWSVALDTEVEI
jgi:hypothetical protein